MNIHTQDDIDTENLISQKLIFCFSQIESILHKSDQKVMKKARGALTPGTNEANEKEVIAMLANQKNDWYKNLKRASSYLTEVKGNLSSIYELKNRRADEIFRLRSENASLKNENAKLKQENNLLRETLK